MKIWAKIIKDGEITRQFVFENSSTFTKSHFYDAVTLICAKLDLSTPVILSKHIFHFVRFNNCVFLPSDFIEEVTFDKLLLQKIAKVKK